jgi:hypothetical protein
MHQNKIDAICLAGGTSLDYFGAIRWGGSERLFAMVIPAKAIRFFVSPAFEEDRAREQIALGPAGKIRAFWYGTKIRVPTSASRRVEGALDFDGDESESKRR